MRVRSLAVVGFVLLLVGVAAPAGEEPLQGAVRALKIARRYLRSAPSDYEGHRTAAVAETAAALMELREALEVGPGGDR